MSNPELLVVRLWRAPGAASLHLRFTVQDHPAAPGTSELYRRMAKRSRALLGARQLQSIGGTIAAPTLAPDETTEAVETLLEGEAVRVLIFQDVSLESDAEAIVAGLPQGASHEFTSIDPRA